MRIFNFTLLKQWPDSLLEDSPESKLKDFQLKEKLYLDAIDFLDQGKVWNNDNSKYFIVVSGVSSRGRILLLIGDI